MDNTNETQWHGMGEKGIAQDASHIPQRPSDFHAADFDATVYPLVIFSGNYGANFCGEYYKFQQTQITKDQAHQLAWAAYGLCGHTITYYDAQGNVVAQE